MGYFRHAHLTISYHNFIARSRELLFLVYRLGV